MSETANAIFFDTLAQFTKDPSAGKAITAAVAAVANGDFVAEAIKEENAVNNLRWLSGQPKETRIEVIALSSAVRKHAANSGERASMSKEPARMRLEHIELAIAIYRHLKKRKAAVEAVVSETSNNTRASNKAVVRCHYMTIKQMRQNRDSRPWEKVARGLYALTGKKIPAAILPSLVAEVEAELADRASLPHEMTHFEGERVPEETKEAYRLAGWGNIEPEQSPVELAEAANIERSD